MSGHEEALVERFLEKVSPEPNSGCWLWTGAVKARGYGAFWAWGRSREAHRVSYELFVGPIPMGLQMDHLCRNSSCTNPSHLEPVTLQENVRRSIAAGGHVSVRRKKQRHCKRGHEFTPENTCRHHDGGRICRACKHINYRRTYYKTRASK